MATSGPATSFVDPLLDSSISEFHANTRTHPYDKLVAGAAVLRLSTTTTATNPEPQILLLQRSATEAYYPSVYELPSGKVGAADATVRDALFRELLEESGLAGLRVLGRLKDLEYETVKTIGGVGEEDAKVIRRRAVQVSFVVEVRDYQSKITVNPQEHQGGGWYGRHELQRLNITDGMKDIIHAAFDWAQENSILIK